MSRKGPQVDDNEAIFQASLHWLQRLGNPKGALEKPNL